MPNTEQKKKSGKNSFNSLLKKINLEEYQKFIGHYASKHKDFKIELEVYFFDKDESIDVSQKYETLIRKLIRRYSNHGFIDYRATYGLAGEVDSLLDTGYDMVNKGNFRDAFLIAKPCLKEMIEVISYCDDSNGNIGGTIHNAVRLIAAVAEANEVALELKEEVFVFLQLELANEQYFNYGDFGYDLFNVYQDLALTIGKRNDYLNFMDNQVAKLTGKYDNYRKEFYLKQKIDFFKANDNPEEVEKLISQNLDIVAVRQGEVDKAIEKKDFVQAKKIIADGIVIAAENNHPGTVSQWEKSLLHIAVLEKDIDTVRHYTKYFAFDRWFNEAYYKQWKATYSPAEWKEIIEKAITEKTDKIIKEHNSNKNKFWHSPNPPLLPSLAPIYIAEKYWDRLLLLVKQDNTLETVLHDHQHLAKKYPTDLLEIYLPAFERQGDEVGKRRDYEDLANKMEKVMKDIPEGKEKIKAIALKLKAKYPRRPAMIDELNRVLH